MSKLHDIGLDDRQIEALSLWHCEGWTQQQVADKMGLSKRTVKRICRAGLAQIKESGNKLAPKYFMETRPKTLYFGDSNDFIDESIKKVW